MAHARSVGALAERFGAQAEPVEVEVRPLRDACALALDNAVEGCVRETFGAVVGTYQAEHARDPEVRRVMKQIAEDETRRAGLAWQIARWVDAKLTPEQRAEVRAAQKRAIEALRAELANPCRAHSARWPACPRPTGPRRSCIRSRRLSGGRRGGSLEARREPRARLAQNTKPSSATSISVLLGARRVTANARVRGRMRSK